MHAVVNSFVLRLNMTGSCQKLYLCDRLRCCSIYSISKSCVTFQTELNQKKRPLTAATQFKLSLSQLMDILMSKEPSYIRTIKPNDAKHARKRDYLKGVISKFWNFLYYWSDLTEIFTQYVKLNKKHFLFLNIFPFRA